MDDDLQTLQREVQRLLGRCVLRLQQYEHRMKSILAHQATFASGPPFESDQAARAAEAANKTLGMLVGELLKTYVTSSELEHIAEGNTPDDSLSCRIRMHLQMSAEDLQKTQQDLKELVQLRNNLVHHFIDQHNLGSLDGCRDARASLLAANRRVDQHVEQLRGWAEQTDHLRRELAEWLQSAAGHDLVINGIAPDGSVSWPAAGIVGALHEAAEALAVGGWTPVVAAVRWIAERHPDQQPAKYGCRSWRQVIHKSRLFALQVRDVDGQRVACYRPRRRSRGTTPTTITLQFTPAGT